ncbi:MAG: Gfo/Idh/MocA family oxidoreductase [Clostridiales bacterium]|jgi:predicted dehydrogenase|nr:Gfo/Idh/MocA family oxidoreductase [Clostridiales bacterium]
MTRIAFIGAGAISGIYLQNICGMFREIEIAGVCDLIPERAEKAAAYILEETGKRVNVYADMQKAFDDPAVDVILNLTRPAEHFAVTKAALLCGKHVYSEKPLAVDMDEANALFALAREKNLRLGGAPDTFLGAGIQTCRRIIDAGLIGRLIGADCAMICRGHETWHPDPEFYYTRGGGPMMDMGPYYISALLNLLGRAKSVTGVTRRGFDNRIITSKPHFGENITVTADTHAAGCIEFDSGAVAQLITTFDAHYTTQARFEVYGSEGTLVVPDPNTFGGPILLFRREDGEAAKTDPALLKPEEISLYRGYRQLPLMFGYRDNSRGLGLADMCKAIETGRPHRANSVQQLHVMEIMTAFTVSSKERRFVDLTTDYVREAPMVNSGLAGVLD